MNRGALLFVAILLPMLSAASFVEELGAGAAREGLVFPGLFVVLCAATAIGLNRAAKIARPVASVLYLVTFLSGAAQSAVYGVAALNAAPFSVELCGRFILSVVVLALVGVAIWWLTRRQTIEQFRQGVQA